MMCQIADHDEPEVGLGMCGSHLSMLTEEAKPKHELDCGVCGRTIEAYEDARVSAPLSWMDDEAWVHVECVGADPLQGPVEPPKPDLEPVPARTTNLRWEPVMDWELSCACGEPGTKHGRLAFKYPDDDGQKTWDYVFLECLPDETRELISDAYGVTLRSDEDPRGGWRVTESPEDRDCVICGSEIPGGQEALYKRGQPVDKNTWSCGECT